jgi:hypothetical protein
MEIFFIDMKKKKEHIPSTGQESYQHTHNLTKFKMCMFA